MIRRLQIRRENTLLLVAMRISYGGTILALLSNLSFSRRVNLVVTD